MSILKKLLSDTVWYGFSSIMGRVINYALVPLYTAALPVAANGVITTLYAYAAFLNVLLTFGMETAYFRFSRGSKGDEEEQAARGQTLIAAICILTVLLVAGAMPWLMGYLGYDHTPLLVWIMVSILISDALTAIPFARLRLQGKAQKFAMYRIGTIGLNVVFNLMFILVVAPNPDFQNVTHTLGADAQPVLWVLYANLLSNAPLLLLINIKHFRLSLLKGAEASFMISYAWPIVVMGFAGMANQMLGILQLERLLPNNFYPGVTNLEAVGVYGQCYKLSIFMALVVQAFRLGAEPFFFSMAGRANKEEGFALVMRWFVLACMGVLLIVSINLSWLAPLILRRDVYFSGLGVVPTLLVANLWLGVYYNLSVWFKLTDRTSWGTWLSIGGLLITIGLNVWLIPIWGYEGAAYSTLLCYFSMAAASYFIGQKYMPTPYPAMRLLVYVGILYWASSTFETITERWDVAWVWALRIAYMVIYALLLLYEGTPLYKARKHRVS